MYCSYFRYNIDVNELKMFSTSLVYYFVYLKGIITYLVFSSTDLRIFLNNYFINGIFCIVGKWICWNVIKQ